MGLKVEGLELGIHDITVGFIVQGPHKPNPSILSFSSRYDLGSWVHGVTQPPSFCLVGLGIQALCKSFLDLLKGLGFRFWGLELRVRGLRPWVYVNFSGTQISEGNDALPTMWPA